jgi:hypothetical protein
MDGERHLSISGPGSGSQRFQHQWPPISFVLERWLEGDAELRGLGIDKRQATTDWEKANPTSAGIRSVHLSDDANV